jgi:proteasome lid subunit RPN8/RPN11
MSPCDNSPLVLISETAQATMTAAALAAHPNETGGILVGVYQAGRPWLVNAIEVGTTDRGRHHYKIPRGATQSAVLAARQADRRLGYLGDWHSHPADVGPSPTDLATLGLISIKHPRIPNPTLVIVRNTIHGYVIDARRVVVIAPRACQVRLTGNLPPEQPPIE